MSLFCLYVPSFSLLLVLFLCTFSLFSLSPSLSSSLRVPKIPATEFHQLYFLTSVTWLRSPIPLVGSRSRDPSQAVIAGQVTPGKCPPNAKNSTHVIVSLISTARRARERDRVREKRGEKGLSWEVVYLYVSNMVPLTHLFPVHSSPNYDSFSYASFVIQLGFNPD